MPFHESLRVTVGAAAPVIQLTNVLATADVWRGRDLVYDAAEQADRPSSQARMGRVRRIYRLAILVAHINADLQTAILSFALGSLAEDHDTIPLIFPQIVPPLGLFLLIITVSLTDDMLHIRRRIEQERQSPRP
jgi:hypothetical protein